MIVAIDGPAGSGKSSTAREVARRLDFLHVDSGAFYRALTYSLQATGVPEETWDGLGNEQLDRLDVRGERGDGGIRMRVGPDVVEGELRTAEVNARVSHVARIPAVRSWLTRRLRDLAAADDVVADGRDIGTVVFPDAALKIFLVADPAVRAQRRLEQMDLPTDPDSIAEEVARIEERDRADSSRDVAPLKQAEGAVLLDTTHLSFDEQVRRIVELARGQGQGTGAG